MIGGYNEEMEDFGKIQSKGIHYVSGSITDNFNGKGFLKLVPKPTTTSTTAFIKQETSEINDNGNHKIVDDSVQITSNGDSMSNDTNVYESNDNFDIDHMAHLDILNESNNENYQLVDASNVNIVDELVSERIKSIMPENLLSDNLLQHNENLNTEIDFEEFGEEFNRNTRS